MTLYWNLPATVYLFSLTSKFQIWESIMFNHYTSSTKRENGSRGRCDIYLFDGDLAWTPLNIKYNCPTKQTFLPEGEEGFPMVWMSPTLLSLSQTLVPLAFHCLWEDFEGRAHGDQNRVGADCEKYSLPERCRLLYLIQCTTAGCCMSATAGNPGRYHRSSDAPAKSPQPYLPPSRGTTIHLCNSLAMPHTSLVMIPSDQWVMMAMRACHH